MVDNVNVKENGKKKKIIISMVIILLLIIGIIICFILLKRPKSNESNNAVNEVENKVVLKDLKMSGNELENFDLAFLKLENNKKNVVYSPLSIKYALAMLSEGATGDTKTQIDNVIGKYETKKYVNSENMSFANALFVKNSYKNSMLDSYEEVLINKFNAEIIYDSFKSPKIVNNWVSEKTFKLIDNLFDDIGEFDYILINALAIDMEWKVYLQASSANNYENEYEVEYKHEDYFDYINPIYENYFSSVKFSNNKEVKSAEIGASINNYDIVNDLTESKIRETITKEYTEFVDNKTCGEIEYEPVDSYVNEFISELDSNYKKVDVSTDFKFYVDESYKVFAKDLKEYDGLTLEYIGIMPKIDSLDDFINEIDAKTLNELISNLKTLEIDNFDKGSVYQITGGIPFFNYDYELDFINDLNKMGISDVFSYDKADLSKMSKVDTHIDDAKHKASIEFSNEGIKAAAVTSEGGKGATGCWFEHLYEVPVEVIDLNFDKPYIYLIRDKDSKEVWFVGSVYEPIENEKGHTIINQ